MLLSIRSEQFAGVIDGSINHGADPRPPSSDGELEGQMSVSFPGVEGRSTCVVNRDLKFDADSLLKKGSKGRNHRLKRFL